MPLDLIIAKELKLPIPKGFKRCTKCGHIKSLTDFHKFTRGKFGRMPACKVCESTCRKIKWKELRMKVLRYINSQLICNYCRNNDIRLLQIDHIHGQGTQERKLGYRRLYNRILNLSSDDVTKEYQLLCANCNHKKNSSDSYSIRLDAISYLSEGNPKCFNCETSDLKTLQIDHIHGDGHIEFARLGSYRLYKRILSMELENAHQEFQILCANCNWLKKIILRQNR